MIFLLLFAVSCARKPGEKLWTKEQRYEKLMQMTNGGVKYASVTPKEMQQVVLDGMQDELGVLFL